MFSTSNTGKVIIGTVASDIILNKGQRTTSIAPGCAILSLLILSLITTPFIWLIMKIFF